MEKTSTPSTLAWSKRIGLAAITAIGIGGPVLVGIIPVHSWGFIVMAVLTLAGSSVVLLASSSSSQWTGIVQRAVIVTVSVMLSLTFADLMARVLLPSLVYYRPHERYASRLPALPYIVRYDKNVSYLGTVSGDMAAMSGQRDDRVFREVAFYTDPYGFRNANYDPERPIDIIILGDSFTVDTTVSQELLWGNVLAKQYGLSVYNLGMVGADPYQEYVNLLMEIDRLNIHEDTILLWMLFNGNDLELPHDTIPATVDDLELNNMLESGLVMYQTFRYRSLTRQAVQSLIYAHSPHYDRITTVRSQDQRNVIFFNPYIKTAGWTVDEIRNKHSVEKLNQLVTAVVRIADEYNLEVVIISAASKAEVYAWMLSEGTPPWTSDPTPSAFSVLLEEMAQENDVCFVDLKQGLIAHSQPLFEETGDLLYWRDDTHWNAAGNQTVADILSKSLCLRDTGVCCLSSSD